MKLPRYPRCKRPSTSGIPANFLLFLLLLTPSSQVFAQHLGFEERVQAQEALERAVYSHQIDARRPFEEAVPRALLEAKVRTYLERSLALSEIWNTPITGEMLRAETARMIRDTRMPERLRERFAALGDDPFLIQECLARPALAERLLRNFYDFDAQIHADSRMMAERTRERLAAGWPPKATHSADQGVLHLVRYKDEGAPGPEGHHSSDDLQVDLPPDEFAMRGKEVSSWDSGVSPVLEERHRFVIQVLKRKSDDEIRLAVTTVPKRNQEEWWREMEPRWKGKADRMSPAADPSASLSLNLPAGGCPADESWDDGRAPEAPPFPRAWHTAVWTGNLMLVWGGSFMVGLQTGGRYDPATDTWSPMSTLGAPSGRSLHTAVWTGSEMIVWGGFGTGGPRQTGGRYDPSTDSWAATSDIGAPSARYEHTAVWTGSRMIIWGGLPASGASGGRYDPATDSWSATSQVGVPSERSSHAAVWTGSVMVVWGGATGSTLDNTGGRYDPVADTWTATSLNNAPAGRKSFTAVWTGSRMILWGGTSIATTYMNSGGRYDPLTDTWQSTSTSSVPAGRNSHVAIWDGTRMIVWGGNTPVAFTQTGGRYDPITDTWSATSLVNAPRGRTNDSVVWTGNRMIVWGGTSGSNFLDSGGRYDPSTDTWTPTSGAEPVSGRRYHTSIWTGNEMVIWGGDNGAPQGDGGRYDPATALWIPLSGLGAPAPRYHHAAVWSGTEMIVWGGQQEVTSFYLNTGGRYNPASDTWLPTNLVDAPVGRGEFVAVWTGTEMVVWGGAGFGVGQTGGRYNPAVNLWTPTSLSNAPPGRFRATAIWTGQKMVVWGGVNANSGGRYDPVADSWQPTSSAGAPTGSENHTAVWTGTRMIIWGGLDSEPVSTGAIYDPVADTWTPTSPVLAPIPRFRHTAVWTGSLMLIWGGSDGSQSLNSGASYEPITGTWSPTMPTPSGRSSHTATWTGEQMIVWGGVVNASFFGSMGGRYCTCANAAYFADQDGDGFGDPWSWRHACSQPPGYVTDSTDCSDAAASIWRAPGEARDLAFADGTQLQWNPPQEPGGTSLFYDVIRSGNAANFTSGGACVASVIPDPVCTDGSNPALGSSFYYLVRARNSCIPGLGPLGTDSSGTARSGIACP